MASRSLKERICHAVCFETFGVFLVSPLAAWVMHRPLFQMGSLAIILSGVAMIWNMVYNTVFDHFFPPGRKRRLPLRIAHGMGFEGGFILIGLPIAAQMLGVPVLQALMLEIGFFLFFLPYTVAYNWIWDSLRHKWCRHAAGHKR